MAEPKTTLGISSIDSLQVFVHDLSAAREQLVEQLGFRQAGLSGAQVEREQQARASLLESGVVRVLLVTPLHEQSEPARWLAQRDEGIARIVLAVENASETLAVLASRGARPGALQERKQGGGLVLWFDLTLPFSPVTLRFIQYRDCPAIPPGIISRAPRSAPYGRLGVGSVHHVHLKVPSLSDATRWLCQTLGLERYWGIEFCEERGLAARSVVLWDRDSRFKLRLEESTENSGCTLLGLSVNDIARTIIGVREAGGALQPVDSRYYAELDERLQILGIDGMGEDVATLRSLQLHVAPAAPRSYQLKAELRVAGALVQLVEQKAEVLARGEAA